MHIDTIAIQERLFRDREIRARILHDYGITIEPQTPQDFAKAVVARLGQTPSPGALDQQLTNDDVFRAAVRALGSNSRKWARFVEFEPNLSQLLNGYNPVSTHRAFEDGTLLLQQVIECLPEGYASRDAKAIRIWAKLLTDVGKFYALLRDVGLEFRQIAQPELSEAELLLCIVGYVTALPVSTRHREVYNPFPPDPRLGKLPGMRYALASEFMRNLHWNGFKPDRHIMRLFKKWRLPAATQEEVSPKVRRLQALLGRHSQELTTYLEYSLIGISATPPGVTFSFTDNLVWLLGVYVEKKGEESDNCYVTE